MNIIFDLGKVVRKWEFENIIDKFELKPEIQFYRRQKRNLFPAEQLGIKTIEFSNAPDCEKLLKQYGVFE